ncbi:hypothetical protein EPH_0015850 [Eimeria praecox]|uniref:Transmembrane protein n=1 Tax=Eimeria praecox TaxID=51316 RepID=U6H0U2_9EIME|nr:hypothetical protein EPH_0015850 [Eimeria praecox]
MLRPIAFAAAAAYVSVSLHEGARAADLYDNKAVTPPTLQQHGDGDEELQEPVDFSPLKATSAPVRPVLGIALLLALSVGLFLFLRPILRSSVQQKGAEGSEELEESELDTSEEVQSDSDTSSDEGSQESSEGWETARAPEETAQAAAEVEAAGYWQPGEGAPAEEEEEEEEEDDDWQPVEGGPADEEEAGDWQPVEGGPAEEEEAGDWQPVEGGPAEEEEAGSFQPVEGGPAEEGEAGSFQPVESGPAEEEAGAQPPEEAEEQKDADITSWEALDYPPLEDPIFLEPEEVHFKIDEMRVLIQRIREAEGSNISVDSTGEPLAFRLRQAFETHRENKRIGFEQSVPPEQIKLFTDLCTVVDEILRHHYSSR